MRKRNFIILGISVGVMVATTFCIRQNIFYRDQVIGNIDSKIRVGQEEAINQSSGDLNEIVNDELYKGLRIQNMESALKRVNHQLQQHQTVLKEQQKLVLALYDKFGSSESIGSDVNDEFVEGRSEDELVDAEDEVRVLDNQIDVEPLDQDWSGTATDKISETLAAEVFQGSALIDLSCRATLCRLNVEHDTVEDVGKFMDNFTHLLQWNTRMRMKETENPDGTVETILYIAREGFLFPSRDNG